MPSIDKTPVDKTTGSDNYDSLGKRQFVVVDVSKTDPPEGESSGKWYQYTIDNGSSPIVGIRSGSERSVKRYAEDFAENLNQRALLGQSSYAKRKAPDQK